MYDFYQEKTSSSTWKPKMDFQSMTSRCMATRRLKLLYAAVEISSRYEPLGGVLKCFSAGHARR